MRRHKLVDPLTTTCTAPGAMQFLIVLFGVVFWYVERQTFHNHAKRSFPGCYFYRKYVPEAFCWYIKGMNYKAILKGVCKGRLLLDLDGHTGLFRSILVWNRCKNFRIDFAIKGLCDCGADWNNVSRHCRCLKWIVQCPTALFDLISNESALA